MTHAYPPHQQPQWMPPAPPPPAPRKEKRKALLALLGGLVLLFVVTGVLNSGDSQTTQNRPGVPSGVCLQTTVISAPDSRCWSNTFAKSTLDTI